jgi:hypothetical protein
VHRFRPGKDWSVQFLQIGRARQGYPQISICEIRQDVFECPDSDNALYGLSDTRIDGMNQCMRMLAPNEACVQRFRKLNVINKATCTPN